MGGGDGHQNAGRSRFFAAAQLGTETDGPTVRRALANTRNYLYAMEPCALKRRAQNPPIPNPFGFQRIPCPSKSAGNVSPQNGIDGRQDNNESAVPAPNVLGFAQTTRRLASLATTFLVFQSPPPQLNMDSHRACPSSISGPPFPARWDTEISPPSWWMFLSAPVRIFVQEGPSIMNYRRQALGAPATANSLEKSQPHEAPANLTSFRLSSYPNPRFSVAKGPSNSRWIFPSKPFRVSTLTRNTESRPLNQNRRNGCGRQTPSNHDTEAILRIIVASGDSEA